MFLRQLGLFIYLCHAFILSEEVFHTYFTFLKDPSTSIVLNVHSTNYPSISCTIKKQDAIVKTIKSEGHHFPLPDHDRFLHFISCDQLLPETLYTFEIYAEEKLLKVTQVETLSSDLEKIKVAIGGDLEIIQVAKPILTKMASLEPSVIFFGGDYPKGVNSLADYKKWDEWLEITTNLLVKKNGAAIPWIMAIGNNEVFGSFDQPVENAPFFHAYFKQSTSPFHYFSLKLHHDLALVILDSGLTEKHDGDQKKWLIERLEEYKDVPLKMALYHVPIYPSVRFSEKNWYYRLAQSISKLKEKKSIANRLFSPQSRDGMIHWAPIFDQYQLTVAFEHHDHCLKRAGPIKDGKAHPHEGTYYLGDGSLAPFPQFTPLQKFFDTRIKKSIGHIQFFWFMTFEKDKIHFHAISHYGKSIDQFSIKGPYE